jgi:5'-deoxynucleotidase YfbR-like HD superfamily hydrolase
MENFFYDDRFCGDLSYLMDVFDIEEPKNLKDDWTCEIELTELEPIFKVDAKKLCQLLCNCNEERLGEEFDSKDEERLLKAITESCDFEKLKELLPKYYYPQSKFKVVTKQDLIDYCA